MGIFLKICHEMAHFSHKLCWSLVIVKLVLSQNSRASEDMLRRLEAS